MAEAASGRGGMMLMMMRQVDVSESRLNADVSELWPAPHLVSFFTYIVCVRRLFVSFSLPQKDGTASQPNVNDNDDLTADQ